jgi:hypothetical protein
MSPLPLRTSTETFQVAESPRGPRGGAAAASAETIVSASVTARMTAVAAPAAIQRATGRRLGGSTGIPESARPR